jgi:hypothetical protein
VENNQQNIINFDPVEHKYTDDNGTVYTSATTLIGKHVTPFNTAYWGMYKALENSGFKVRQDKLKKGIYVNGVYKSLVSLYKNPINSYEVQLLTKEWQDITDIACARGNEVHDYLEDSINNSKSDKKGETNDLIKPSFGMQYQMLVMKTQHDLEATGIQDRYPIIYNRLKGYIKMGCTLFAEKKVFSVYYQIAGMIDVLIVHMPSRRFCIMDWKTNKDIMMFRSGYFKKEWVNGTKVKTDTYIEKDTRLLHPINDLQECKGIIYSLQLSLYAYIMKLWGFTLIKDGLEIFHIRPDRHPKLIKVKYYEVHIQKMLEHHYKKHILKLTNSNTFGIT